MIDSLVRVQYDPHFKMYSMKSNKFLHTLLFFIAFSLILSSCGGEEEEEDLCAPEAWAGTWVANATCAGMPLDLTLVITAVDENTIRVEAEGETDEVDVNGCNVNVAQQVEFLGMTVDLDLDMMLNGEMIDVDIDATIAGFTTVCTGVLTRM